MLSQKTVLASVASGTIRFASTVDGAVALAVNTAGDEVFEGAVTLLSLETDAGPAAAGGSTIFGASGGSPVSVTTSQFQTYHDAVKLVQNGTLTSTGAAALEFLMTIDGPAGLTTQTKGLTALAGAAGGQNRLQFLTITSGGPFALQVPVTAQDDISVSVTRLAGSASGDEDITLNPAAVARVLSLDGDIEFLADNDILQTVNSIIEATHGSVVLSGDARNTSASGTTINLSGRINAPQQGKSVTINGNQDADHFTLAGTLNSPRTDVHAAGGRDVVNVERTLQTTTTGLATSLNLVGGGTAGSNLTTNLGDAAGSLDPIQGTINIKGTPVDQLPGDMVTLVNYCFTTTGLTAGAIR